MERNRDEVEDPPCRRRLFSDTLIWTAFAVALAADQVTKNLVTASLVRGESWPLDGLFRFTYARNTGTIFGLFPDQGTLLTIVSFAALAGLVFFFRSSSFNGWIMRAGLGLMIGGAIGNLVDRVRLGFVVDFIDVGPWPIFNLADSFIVTGIAIIAWSATFRPHDIGHDGLSPQPEAGSAEQSDTLSNRAESGDVTVRQRSEAADGERAGSAVTASGEDDAPTPDGQSGQDRQ